MYTLQYDWKEFRVFLPAFQAWLGENAGASYCGMSGNSKLELHFNEEPSEEIKTAIDAMWDSLTEEGEAAKWSHINALKAAEAAARDAILTAAWDDMVPAERKIAMGRPLSESDLEALLVKYPS